MGMDFQMSETFLDISLKKWLPRMNDEQRSSIAASMYDFFLSMKKEKKTEGMLKNAYIKFMCWLYYKFERMVNLLGENQVPKILYEGEVSRYELMLLTVLCHAGCDVVLLQYQGDGAYSRLDADDRYSFPLVLPGMQAFPEGFSLAGLREQQKKKMETGTSLRSEASDTECYQCLDGWRSASGSAESASRKRDGSRIFL